MTNHDLFPVEMTPELKVLKLELGDEITQLTDSIESAGFEDETAEYAFTDAGKIVSTWLPSEIAAITIAEDTELRNIKVCYHKVSTEPRPSVTVVIYLKNGERITLSKNPLEAMSDDFSFDYSATQNTLDPVQSKTVGLIIASLLCEDVQQMEVTLANFDGEDKNSQTIDPTDPLMSQIIQQVLPQHADSWTREESISNTIEDDRNEFRVTKQTSSNGLTKQTVSFVQNGSDTAPNSYLELTGKLLLVGNETTHMASLEYDSIVNGEQDDGFGEKKPYLFDIMKAAIAREKLVFDKISPEPSYDDHVVQEQIEKQHRQD